MITGIGAGVVTAAAWIVSLCAAGWATLNSSRRSRNSN